MQVQTYTNFSRKDILNLCFQFLQTWTEKLFHLRSVSHWLYMHQGGAMSEARKRADWLCHTIKSPFIMLCCTPPEMEML